MKFTVDGNIFEGTPEEIKEMMTLLGAEFPESDEAEEVAEETPTFKEGDRVKTLADGQFGDILKGELGEVEYLNNDLDEGDLYFISVRNAETFDYFRPQDLELVTEGETGLKVGDYAKFVKVDTGTGGIDIDPIPVGDVVKLTGTGSAFDFHIKRVSDGYVSLTNAENLARATDKEVKVAKIGRKPGEFKKGDIVKTVLYGIVELVDIDESDVWKYGYRDGRGKTSRLSKGAELTLIAPVEARVDL